ncbi:MAG: helix-turn-helix domain-containing protein [Acidobacteria bacterium]|nr:helix-turn-helix domain-containing protein [Acidobacteriota bacterium]
MENSKNIDFIERFTEVCGSSQPNEIAQLLNISYQAAKNYLQGRLPDSKTLTTIAYKTPYSLNWLLTGEGEKLVRASSNEDTSILSEQLRGFVKKVCTEFFTEMLSGSSETAQAKIVYLAVDNIKEEKLSGQIPVTSEPNSQ